MVLRVTIEAFEYEEWERAQVETVLISLVDEVINLVSAVGALEVLRGIESERELLKDGIARCLARMKSQLNILRTLGYPEGELSEELEAEVNALVNTVTTLLERNVTLLTYKSISSHVERIREIVRRRYRGEEYGR